MPGSDTKPDTAGSRPQYRRLAFGPCEVDLERGTLTCRGEEIFLRPKTFAVLIHLLENAGRLVSREELLAAVWPGVIVTEASVTQCLIELRKALGDTDRKLIRTVPRRGVMFEAPVRYADAPDLPAPSESGRSRGSRPAWAVALVAVAMLAVWWARPMSSTSAPDPSPYPKPSANSIAVLPFLDLSPANDKDYFADGISEEILNELAQIPELTVISRTSSFAFKGTNLDVRSIGKQLDVAAVLEGSVRTDGEVVRVTAQLVNAGDGRQLWSKTYDGPLDTVFGVQTRIAEQVAHALQVEASGLFDAIARSEPQPDAYRLVLQGQALYRFRAEGDVRKARELFRRATEIDPEYAIAWARLAAACRVLYANGEIDYAELIRVGLPAATRGLELRPDLFETQFRAANFANLVGDYELANMHREQARRINPEHPFLLSNDAHKAVLAGDARRAIELQRRAVAVDPLSPAERVNMVSILYFAGQFDAMRREAEVAMRMGPGATRRVVERLLRAAVAEHDHEQALRLLEAMPPGLKRDSVLALLEGQPDLQGAAAEAMSRLQSDESIDAAVWFAEAQAWRGNFDAAFESLGLARARFEAAESAIPYYQPIVETRISPFLEPLHGDPRWVAWLEALPFQDIFNRPAPDTDRQLAQSGT